VTSNLARKEMSVFADEVIYLYNAMEYADLAILIPASPQCQDSFEQK